MVRRFAVLNRLVGYLRIVRALNMSDTIHLLTNVIDEILRKNESTLKPLCSVSLFYNVSVMIIAIYGNVNITTTCFDQYA
jgi:hypothetical protein